MNAFLLGVASIFDCAGVLAGRDYYRDDGEAIASDWRAVGDDIRRALHLHRETTTVPRVNGKHYPYSESGMKAAKAESERTGKPMEFDASKKPAKKKKRSK